MESDPLTNLERELEQNYPGWTEIRAKNMEVISEEIEDAFEFAKSSPYPAYSSLLSQVFG
jgi:TPP-dependent pyruvate/acetoin dehydrogenase alpha subunit